jgi:hypothetical protein
VRWREERSKDPNRIFGEKGVSWFKSRFIFCEIVCDVHTRCEIFVKWYMMYIRCEIFGVTFVIELRKF